MNTYEKAILHFGADSQITKAIEEMSELTKELCKYANGKDNLDAIAEEIADCEVMLEQLKYIFNCRLLANHNIQRKLNRLEKIIEKERYRDDERKKR